MRSFVGGQIAALRKRQMTGAALERSFLAMHRLYVSAEMRFPQEGLLAFLALMRSSVRMGLLVSIQITFARE